MMMGMVDGMSSMYAASSTNYVYDYCFERGCYCYCYKAGADVWDAKVTVIMQGIDSTALASVTFAAYILITLGFE